MVPEDSYVIKLIEILRKKSSAFNVAYTLAEEVHKDDKRSDDKPYITHIAVVVLLTFENEFKDKKDLEEGSTFWLKLILAALHDAYEDHPAACPLETIQFLLMPFLGVDQTSKVLNAIIAISKTDHNLRTYPQYVGDVLLNELARPVKIADLTHNLNINSPNGSRRDKYQLTLSILSGEFAKLIINEQS